LAAIVPDLGKELTQHLDQLDSDKAVVPATQP
jgi:hypothetical protein